MLDAGDPGQGKPMLKKAEMEIAKGFATVGPKWELTIQAPVLAAKEVVQLDEVERFPEALYKHGSKAIRKGEVSFNGPAVQMVQVAHARQLTEQEDMDALTIFGTTAEVMDRDLYIAPKRAAHMGQTEANGGVYMYLFDAKAEFPDNVELQR